MRVHGRIHQFAQVLNAREGVRRGFFFQLLDIAGAINEELQNLWNGGCATRSTKALHGFCWSFGRRSEIVIGPDFITHFIGHFIGRESQICVITNLLIGRRISAESKSAAPKSKLILLAQLFRIEGDICFWFGFRCSPCLRVSVVKYSPFRSPDWQTCPRNIDRASSISSLKALEGRCRSGGNQTAINRFPKGAP